MKRTLEVFTSGYYACNRAPSQRKLNDMQLLQIIKVLFKTHRKTYGGPRIHDALKNLGHRVGKNRVTRIMRENDLSARRMDAWRCGTTQSDPTHHVAENVLD
jgi:putative transposase